MPPLLKWQLETRGSQLLGRQLRVGQIQFSPIALTLTLRELSMASASGDAPQLQVERLFVDLDARSLLRLAPVIAALEIDAPHMVLQTSPVECARAIVKFIASLKPAK